jgi:hypothetical protein
MQGIQERLAQAEQHVISMFEHFVAYLQAKGKTLEQAHSEDICQYVIAQTFPPVSDGHGHLLVSENKAIRTLRLLFVLYDFPKDGRVFGSEDVLQASRESRILLMTSWRGDFASASVDFALYTPSMFPSEWKAQTLMIFDRPCHLTTELVALLNENLWEREHDCWNDLGRLRAEFRKS